MTDCMISTSSTVRSESRTRMRLLACSACLTILCALAGCAPRTLIVPDVREIKALPDGRYSVSPGWLRERYRLERQLLDQMEGCGNR
ncbi:MAG: hypothetical protein HZA22_00335 [Nitrospirae bacterium]|nr:hypothetical protein [Nitrospirota bacterium]